MFVVTAEIYPSAIRGTAMALSTGISWACAFLVVQFFPVMLESFGAAIVFAGFGLLCLAAWLFICIWIPETKGRSLEEIEKQLLKKE
jgi:drug/metabolite transporter (DMT)-like permease